MPCNARHLLDIMYISLQQILRPFFGCFGGIFLRFWCGIFISLARASIWCIQIFCSSFSSRDTIGNFTYDFFRFFFRFSRKIAENSSFFAKNEKTKKMEAILATSKHLRMLYFEKKIQCRAQEYEFSLGQMSNSVKILGLWVNFTMYIEVC